MKMIVLVILIFTSYMSAQQNIKPKFNFQILITTDSSSKATYTLGSIPGGKIRAILKGKDGHLSSISNSVDLDFTKTLYPPETTFIKPYDSQKRIDTILHKSFLLRESKNDYDIIIDFSMHPDINIIAEYLPRIKETGALIFYTVYKKYKTINDSIYYTATFYDKYNWEIPINKKFFLQVLSEYFPRDKIDAILSYENIDIETLKKLYNPNDIIEAREYSKSVDDITQKARESKLADTKIKLGMEFVRLDKAREEILIRKLEYPMSSGNVLLTENEFIELKTFIYKQSITLPLEIYTPSKLALFSKSDKLLNSKITYIVYAIPLEKIGDKYRINLFTLVKYLNGTLSYSNTIDLKPGDKFKLPVNLLVQFIENIGIEKLEINTKEDCYKYVNDYIVISLEK